MEYWNNENCFLCCNTDQGAKRYGLGGRSLEEALRNLFEVLGISFTSIHTEWCDTPVLESWKLVFCDNCDVLIAKGMDLKKQLRRIKSDLVDNALGLERERGIRPAKQAEDLLPEVQRIRRGLRKLILQCFGGCEVKIQKTSVVPKSLKSVDQQDSIFSTHLQESLAMNDDNPLHDFMRQLQMTPIEARSGEGEPTAEGKLLDSEAVVVKLEYDEYADAVSPIPSPASEQHLESIQEDNFSEPLSEPMPLGDIKIEYSLMPLDVTMTETDVRCTNQGISLQSPCLSTTTASWPQQLVPYVVTSEVTNAPGLHSRKTPPKNTVEKISSVKSTPNKGVSTKPKSKPKESGPGVYTIAKAKLKAGRPKKPKQMQMKLVETIAVPPAEEIIPEEELIGSTGRKRRRCTLKVKDYAAVLKYGEEVMDIESADEDSDKNQNDCEPNKSKTPRDKDWEEGMDKRVLEEIHQELAHATSINAIDIGPVTFESHACTVCPEVFTTPTVLDLHIQEFHNSTKEDLSFKCRVCDLELRSNDCKHNESFGRSEPYILSLYGKAQYFSNFFELCEYHFLRCHRERELKKIRDEDEQKNVFDEKRPLEGIFHGDFHFQKECILCHIRCRDDYINVHFNSAHGLEAQGGDRVACKYCFNIFPSASEELPSGKFLLEDFLRLQDFVTKHANCKIVSNPPKEHKCRFCEETFNHPTKLFSHEMRVHPDDPPFSCSLCLQKFWEWTRLQNHSVNKHKAGIRCYCGRCSASFLSRSEYNQHMYDHAAKEIIKCRRCFETIIGVQRFNAHMKSHNIADNEINERSTVEKETLSGSSVNPGSTYNCYVCEQIFYSTSTLQIHLREVHDGDSGLKFQCRSCQEIFSQDDYKSTEEEPTSFKYPTLKKGDEDVDFNRFSDFCESHVRTCTTVRELESSKFNCGKCDEIFSGQVDVYRHLVSHYLHLVTKCFACRFTTASSSDVMDQHLYMTHKIVRVFNNQCYCRYCHECFQPANPELETGRVVPEESRKFRNFTNSHARCYLSIDQITSFECKFCQETFNHPRELFKHEIKSHTKNFPMYCDQCGIGFFEMRILRKHTISHIATLDFKCDQCPQSFKTADRLGKHVALHIAERSHMCEHCGKCFRTKSHLSLHCSRVHGNEDFPCHECGKVFRSKVILYSHVYQVHQRRAKSYRMKDERDARRAANATATSTCDSITTTEDQSLNNEDFIATYLQL